MIKLTIRRDSCKGCGLCVDACPRDVLAISRDKINKRGHHSVEAVRPENCIGCACCAVMCPDCVIKVER